MRFVSLLFFFLLLSGCTGSSFIQNRDKHYLTAKSNPSLVIPPGISSHAFHAEYPITGRDYSYASKEVSIVPPGLNEQD